MYFLFVQKTKYAYKNDKRETIIRFFTPKKNSIYNQIANVGIMQIIVKYIKAVSLGYLLPVLVATLRKRTNKYLYSDITNFSCIYLQV